MFDIFIENNNKIVIITKAGNSEPLGKNIKVSIPIADINNKINEHHQAIEKMESRKNQKQFLEGALSGLGYVASE